MDKRNLMCERIKLKLSVGNKKSNLLNDLEKENKRVAISFSGKYLFTKIVPIFPVK